MLKNIILQKLINNTEYTIECLDCLIRKTGKHLLNYVKNDAYNYHSPLVDMIDYLELLRKELKEFYNRAKKGDL